MPAEFPKAGASNIPAAVLAELVAIRGQLETMNARQHRAETAAARLAPIVASWAARLGQHPKIRKLMQQ